MDLYEKLVNVVRNNVLLSTGLIFEDIYEGKNNILFEFTMVETNEDIPLWRLNDMLDTLKRKLYLNGVESIICEYQGFEKVHVKCYQYNIE